MLGESLILLALAIFWSVILWTYACKWAGRQIMNMLKRDFPEQAEEIHQEVHRRTGTVCGHKGP